MKDESRLLVCIFFLWSLSLISAPFFPFAFWSFPQQKEGEHGVKSRKKKTAYLTAPEQDYQQKNGIKSKAQQQSMVNSS